VEIEKFRIRQKALVNNSASVFLLALFNLKISGKNEKREGEVMQENFKKIG